LAVGKTKEVADGAVGGRKPFLYRGLANGVAGIGELATKRLRQCGKLLKARQSLAIEAVEELAEAVRG